MAEDTFTEDASNELEHTDIQEQLTLEQAQEAVCVHFNNALFLSQFPEINEHLQDHISGWVANNPQYTEALEKLISCLAVQLDLQVSKVEAAAGEPMLDRYSLCGNGNGKCPPSEPDVAPDSEEPSCHIAPRRR